MDFAITEEQSLLQDSVAKFIDNDYDFEKRMKHSESELGYSAEDWQEFANLGWTAVPFPEEDGGLDGGPVELMLIMEQFGRGLVVEPYLASIVLAGGALRRTADEAQKADWLMPLIEGSKTGALAYLEPQSRYRLADVALSAKKDGDDYVLNGEKGVVLNGATADVLVVSARTTGGQKDEDGISLFVLAADSDGVKRRGYATVDGQKGAEITFKDVRVPAAQRLGEEGKAYPVLQSVLQEATLAVCAEAVGIMEKLNHKTLEYTKSRVQFGVPIAAFQALQHRMVEMFMLYEQTKSLLLWAVMAQDSEDADEARRAISAIKYQVGTAGRQIGEEAVQLHGGMGVTWELDVAHYFKRLTVINTLFGNADFHVERYAGLM
ncbi:acyl-CoA dehydrogenase family protein [Lentisalinibacter sediminis]|uniref:acyl-CoA dehydrogenase family protein n=1 Tax=Lentisalinibacter sediminis TaxID=2992237 RepID=UPI003866AE2F